MQWDDSHVIQNKNDCCLHGLLIQKSLFFVKMTFLAFSHILESNKSAFQWFTGQLTNAHEAELLRSSNWVEHAMPSTALRARGSDNTMRNNPYEGLCRASRCSRAHMRFRVENMIKIQELSYHFRVLSIFKPWKYAVSSHHELQQQELRLVFILTIIHAISKSSKKLSFM